MLDPRRKVLSRDAVIRWRRSLSGSLVFTNGVFDLLHPGHVDLLVRARDLGSYLAVGLNTDDSARRLGKSRPGEPTRPIRTESDRAFVLAALEAVDAVVAFGEDTPLELIRELEPDVLVKGGDYEVDSVVGAAEVLGRGGSVHIIPLVPGHSTTALVRSLSQVPGGVNGA